MWVISVPGVPGNALHADLYEVAKDGMGPGKYLILVKTRPVGRAAIDKNNCVVGV